MTTTATREVQVTISPGAAALAAERRVRDVLDRIVDRMREINPHVWLIRADREPSPWDETATDHIAVEGWEDETRIPGDLQYKYALTHWLIETYPPETTSLFVTGFFAGRPE
jgi:hypothetical protein